MTPAARFLVRLSFVASMVIIGAAAGGAVASVTARGGMGWDQIAAALGGFMVGAFAGGVVAVLLVRRLADAALGRAAVVALMMAGALVAWGLVRANREMARAAAEQAPRPMTPTEPPR